MTVVASKWVEILKNPGRPFPKIHPVTEILRVKTPKAPNLRVSLKLKFEKKKC